MNAHEPKVSAIVNTADKLLVSLELIKCGLLVGIWIPGFESSGVDCMLRLAPYILFFYSLIVPLHIKIVYGVVASAYRAYVPSM